MTEAKLIQGCLKNNRRSQKQLYDQYSGQMYSICLRYCHDEHAATEVLQIGFIKVFKHLKTYQSTGPLGGWIRKIIIRSALDYIRKVKSIGFLSIDSLDQNKFSYDEEINFDDYNYQQLMTLINELAPGYRLVFTMFVIDDMSHAEIGKALKITQETSRSQLHKARKKLQELVRMKTNLIPKSNIR